MKLGFVVFFESMLYPGIDLTKYYKLCKPFIFQTLIVWYNRSHSLKYLRSTTLGCLDIGI